MSPLPSLASLANPLIPNAYLWCISSANACNYAYMASYYIQATTVLLDYPQLESLQAIVLMQRFYVLKNVLTNDDRDNSADVSKDLSYCTAAIVLAYKSNGYVPNIKAVMLVLLYVDHFNKTKNPDYTPKLSDDSMTLFSRCEKHFSAILNFDFEVKLPHTLMLPYIQLLGLDDHVQLIWNALNDMVISSPWLMLLHQPNTIACTAIDSCTGKIVDEELEWWHLFDVDTNDLEHCKRLVKYV